MMAGSSSRLELLPLEGSSSAVWNHFGFPSKDGRIIQEKKKRNEVQCKICSKVLKYNGSTTNLRFHLKEYHKSVYALISRYYHYCDTSSQKYRDSDFTTIAQA